MAVLILAVCALPCFAAAPSLTVGASKYQVNPGDEITVSVNLSSGSNLKELNFTLNYNTSEFEYVKGSVSVGLFDAVYNDQTAGTLKYFGSTEDVVNAGGAVFTAKFKVLSYGGLLSVNVTSATGADDTSVKVNKTNIKLTCAHGKMKWETTKFATCTEDGEETGTCPCGHSDTRVVDMTDHKYTDPVVKKPATCTEDGIKSGTCIVCKKTGAETKIPATGHKYTEWVITKQPTIITKGLKERTCLTCGDKQEKEITSAEEIDNTTSTTLPPVSEEPSTERPTLQNPITPTQPSTSPNYYEIPTESQTDPSGGFFGNSDFSESDRAALLVIVLSVVVVVVLVVYILLLRQRKK